MSDHHAKGKTGIKCICFEIRAVNSSLHVLKKLPVLHPEYFQCESLLLQINPATSFPCPFKMSFSYHNSNNVLPQRSIDHAGFGKVAIITGCASGVGLATTQLLLSHQYEVLGVDIHEIDYAKIDERDQGQFHFHKGDLIEPGECDEVVRICVAKYG